jgi:Protein of unknown function (DUF3073)
MGRGRQKAKQTKVARQLKYFSPDTDYNALQRELASSGHPADDSHAASAADLEHEGAGEGDGDDDEYAEWAPGHGH